MPRRTRQPRHRVPRKVASHGDGEWLTAKLKAPGSRLPASIRAGIRRIGGEQRAATPACRPAIASRWASVAPTEAASSRLGEVIKRNMAALHLGPDLRQATVALPAYLAAHSGPGTPSELLDHRRIRWRWPGYAAPDAWKFREDGRWLASAATAC